jgi:hypothetical protein
MDTRADGIGATEGELTLFFDNQRPIAVGSVAKLLQTLGREYGRFSEGGELVLVEARQGSLRLKFGAIAVATATALNAVDGANHLYEFGDHIRSILSAARAGDVSPVASAPLLKSAQAIAETAAKSRSNLRLDYRAPSGERLFLELDRSETKPVQKLIGHAARLADRAKHVDAGTHLKLPPYGTPNRVLIGPADVQLDRLVDDYEHRRLASPTPDEAERQDAALVTAIQLLVEALDANGSGYLIDSIAQRLDERGLHAAANKVRAARGDGEADQTVSVRQ